MKGAKEDIIQTIRGNTTYYLSIIQKENDSGIYFNERLLFLMPESHIGYISEIKMNEPLEKINFQKIKTSILISSLRKLTIKENLVYIKYEFMTENKKIQKQWILRMLSEVLARKWFDKINKEMKSLEIRSKLASSVVSKNIEKPEPKVVVEKSKPKLSINSNNQSKLLIHEQSVPPKSISRQKTLSISRHISYTQIVKPKKVLKQAGTQITPENSRIMDKQQHQNDQLLKQEAKRNEQREKQIIRQHQLQLYKKQQDQQKNKRLLEQNQRGKNGQDQNDRRRTENNAFKRTQSQEKTIKKSGLQRKDLLKEQQVDSFKRQQRQYIEEEEIILQKSRERKRNYEKQQRQKIKNQENELFKKQQQRKRYQTQRQQIKKSQAELFKKQQQRKRLQKQMQNERMKQNEKNKQEKQFKRSHRHQDTQKSKLQQGNRHKLSLNNEMYLMQRNNYKNLAYLAQKNKKKQLKKEASENPYWKDIPWTYKYIKYDHLIFDQFQAYAEELMKQAINKYLASASHNKINQGIFVYNKNDVEVKIGIMELVEVKDEEKKERKILCDKKNIRILENQFKNYHALYHLLGKNKLRVPLTHLCESNGFIGLIKIKSQYKQTRYPFPDIQSAVKNITPHLKHRNDFNQTLSQHIFQLNDPYYQKFKHIAQDKTSFNYYFIQNIEPLLVQDHIYEHSDDSRYFRQELIIQSKDNQQIMKQTLLSNKSKKVGEIVDKQSQEIQKISRYLLKAIADTVIELDNLHVFFYNSEQFSEYLHSKGISIRYLGYIYDQLKMGFQKKIIMSEMAARCCKNLHRKTFQDQIIEQKGRYRYSNSKICDFFNCIVGNGPQTIQLWKVISNQSKFTFGVQTNIDSIDKNHFILSLIQNCRLNVNWQKLKPELAFQQSQFFTQQNLLGLKIINKRYKPYYSDIFMKYSEASHEKSKESVEKMMQELNLAEECLPHELKDQELQIKVLLSSIISPKRHQGEFPHLEIYTYSKPIKPSKLHFQIILNHIKWSLQLQQKYQYIRTCDLFIRFASQFYGDFHPAFSLLYDVFSAYHLSKSQYEDAIVFAKSSLVNILKISGSNHSKTSQCYFHLALCYIKVNKKQDAIFALIKAKSIYEYNNQVRVIPYGKICLKLALLYLNLDQIPECIQQITRSLDIFSVELSQQSNECEDETIQCYQILYRCFQLLNQTQQMLQLSSECYSKLKYISKISNLQTALKIYLYPKILSIEQSNVVNYTSFITNLSSKLSYNYDSNNVSLDYLKARIEEQKLEQNLRMYLSQLKIILGHISQRNIMRDWQSYKKVYQRQTVNDFISLNEEIISFLGGQYILNILNQIQ